MSVFTSYQNRILTALIFTIYMLLSSWAASASTQVLSEKATSEALSIVNKIESEKLLTEDLRSVDDISLQGLTISEQIRMLRHYTQGAITLSNKLEQAPLLKLYKNKIDKAGTPRDTAIFTLQTLFLENIDLTDLTGPNETVIAQLETATSSTDWYEASNAWLLLSLVSSFTDNDSLALQQAQTSYSLIPNKLSPYVVDARISTLVVTTFLNNVMLDPERAIENTSKLISQKLEAGYPIDGMSLLNNLVFSLTNWREYRVSTKFTEAMIRLEEVDGANIPGLSESRIAKLLIRQTKFKEALPYISRGLKKVDILAVKEDLIVSEILASAGKGEITDAKIKLTKFKESFGKEYPDYVIKDFIAAEAAIAIAEKDTQQAFYFNYLSQDMEIQNFLRRYNSNTSKMLATLESSKERQAERESALKREAVLKQSELDQQKNTNRLLIIVASLLALAAIFALLFARFRNNVSKVLAVKTLEAEDADRMKSEFLGMVSHELRTPLNGIVGIADLLAMQAPNPDLRHKAGIILDSSNKLTHVIESIVDMSRIDGDKMELYPEPTDIHSIVMDLDQLWRPTIENKGVTFTRFVDDSLIDEIILDKSRFRQCLNNLLSNAANFTDSGRVHLHVTSCLIANSDEIEIIAIIADTGQGMSETVQEKLFTPFLQADSTMTRKHGGSGLGLAITQSLARMMGGDVTMVSKQNRGSEFTLTVRGEKSDSAKILDDVEALIDGADMVDSSNAGSALQDLTIPEEDSVRILEEVEIPVTESTLPISKTVDIDINTPEPAAQPIKAPVHVDPENLRGLKVLIVEDITANQDVIKLFLGPEGCVSKSAHNGIEALEVLDTQTIDIILMDIRMPDMDGIEATRAIRNSGRKYKNTPIIALTADVSAETNAACMAAGADIFLTKPVMARELIESIKFIRRFQDYDDDTAINAA